ncbi:DUF1682-domain-containing protein [Obba rivulosa]|uniref:DUF1682-domain-containing protein n=1 Tax=Obba rivulosa TaxID=1052685 RepID=A0A8E2J3X4_9APHY|nr:DUF1682-domain-containing protein [Obba rivulosa]
MATRLLRALTPPPPNISAEYDGLEFRYKFITFRPALFKNEIFFLLAVGLYLAMYFIGKKANERKVKTWFNAHKPIYDAQFSKPYHKGSLTQDGNTDFFNFSTGRRAVASLHTVFALRPRHDLFQYAFQVGRGLIDLDYRVCDELELDFTFKDTSNVPECVWAVVAKDEMRTIRNERWDLTFTKTSEHSSLPPALTVMSEFADITENMLKPYGSFSLTSVLSSPSVLPYFRSLSITDQPSTRPESPLPASERSKRLRLSLRLPGPNGAEATRPLVEAIFQLIDIVAGETRSARGGLSAALRPETRAKLRKAREEVDRQLREEAAKEKREEAEEKRTAAKKKAEEERLSRLSAAEQKKELEREKKRAMRKTQGKVKMR